MVKGISRQVIVVDAPEPKMFEQAIFILRDGAPMVTDEALLKEADRLVRSAGTQSKRIIAAPLWAFAGALLTGLVWALSLLI